jgi:myo-inositol catabolism protein IolC
MTLGYDADLFILAFDHRGSFRKRFGIAGTPDADELDRLKDAKMLVFEGFRLAFDGGIQGAGVLVDEEMGAAVAAAAKEAGITLAMPVEKSGQDVFDFEYGDDFGSHIEHFDPAFSKVLVRWNPADDPENKTAQGDRLRRLSDWLHDRDRKFLFELLVPATDDQLAEVGGDTGRYDTEIRPVLTVESMAEIRQAGIEPDVWKIEGLDDAGSCRAVADFITSGGRDQVMAVVLGRGADDAKVDHWLQMGAPVPGYRGFAIGRSIWGPGIDGFVAGDLDRNAAAEAIAAGYRRFYDVYRAAAG